jgi:hypothetical protein
MEGTDFKGVRFENPNLDKRLNRTFKKRFEYDVNGNKDITRISL